MKPDNIHPGNDASQIVLYQPDVILAEVES